MNNLQILNIEGLNKSIRLINNSLNTACKRGIFDLDEAYLLKIAISNMDSCVKTLDQYQQFVSNTDSNKKLIDNSNNNKNINSINNFNKNINIEKKIELDNNDFKTD